MSNEVATTGTKEVAKPEKQLHLLQRDDVKAKFKEVLGSNAISFVTSVLSAVNSNEKLKLADQNSIYMSAMMAASLNLPINQNLGFAYLIPFDDRKNNKLVCQFQIGYKGLKQLAIRSGQYADLDSKPVYEGQKVDDDSFRGYHFVWKAKKSDTIIGYASWYKLLTGFESLKFMTVAECREHAKTYSQTFKNPKTEMYSKWATDFDKMALKTVTKLHLNAGEAPLSIEMQKAIIADQAIIQDAESQDVRYPDNEQPTAHEISKQKEYDQRSQFIESAKTIEQLEQVEGHLEGDQIEMFMAKKNSILDAGN
jgi:recombination protein RecT